MAEELSCTGSGLAGVFGGVSVALEIIGMVSWLFFATFLGVIGTPSAFLFSERYSTEGVGERDRGMELRRSISVRQRSER